MLEVLQSFVLWFDSYSSLIMVSGLGILVFMLLIRGLVKWVAPVARGA